MNVKNSDQRKPLIKVEVESEIEFHSGKKTPKHYFETKKINFLVSSAVYERKLFSASSKHTTVQRERGGVAMATLGSLSSFVWLSG